MATVTLRPFGQYAGHDGRDRRARRAARVPHPDHDRRPAVRDRHRRHGPRRALQRAGDERPRRRGVRRRRRHPARQDRHDHLRQPARVVDHAGARRRRGATSCEAALVASIRDETPEGRSIVDLARKRLAELGLPAATATTPASRRSTRPSPRTIAFRAETRTSGVRTDRRRPRSSRAPSMRSRPSSTARCRPRSRAEADRIADLGATPLAIRERRPRSSA